METRCRKPLLPDLVPRRGLRWCRLPSPELCVTCRPRLAHWTLCGQIARLQRMQFGASSEKLTREIAQLELTLEELEIESAVPEIGAVSSEAPVRALPDLLPCEEVLGEPASGACTCPNYGGALRRFGQDAYEMPDVLPVHWRVVRNVRRKYSCRTCEKIVQAAAPVKAVARGKATFATLAHVVISMFEHHLPLHRRSEMMAAQAWTSTARRWRVGQAAALLDPNVSRIREEVLKGDNIHVDDTPVPVLDPAGRLWVYAVDDRASGNTPPPATWYRFTTDRTVAPPKAHLATNRGFLQADAFAGYDGLCRTASPKSRAGPISGARCSTPAFSGPGSARAGGHAADPRHS
jgi:transposase